MQDADKKNPLGRVLAIYSDSPGIDLETLELKLDEAILTGNGADRNRAEPDQGALCGGGRCLVFLGTVVGMIATFQMITLFGTGDPRMMAGGISTALVTTVLGLTVAIPLTLFS